MGLKAYRIVLAIFVAVLSVGGTAWAIDPCVGGACCVDPTTCVVTDKATLAGLTIDSIVPCKYTLGTCCSPGDSGTGIAPCPIGICGLNFCGTDEPKCPALNALDHHWQQSTTVPKVVDFGSPKNAVLVFVAVDHGPFPEEGIEATVWGSDSCDVSSFPAGWTPATLTTIWKRGWEDPVACQGIDNTDDFVGQYSFAGPGFQFVAVHANFSISIFTDPSHTTWTGANDDSGVPGWQSYDDEIDAVGTPVCDPGQVVADAGHDQTGDVGGQACFDGSGSSATSGISLYGWDLNGDGTIDVNGASACLDCQTESEGDVTLFVTDTCGCVDSDTAHFHCIACHPNPLTQGYWHRQCLGTGEIRPGRTGRGPSEPTEPNFASDLEPCADTELEDLGFYATTTCEGMDAVPANDPCERALKQLTAVILNVCSDRLQDGCEVDVSTQGCSSTNIGDLVNEIATLIQNGDCQTASDCAAAVNEGTATTESGGRRFDLRPKPEVKKPSAAGSGSGAQATDGTAGAAAARPGSRRIPSSADQKSAKKQD